MHPDEIFESSLIDNPEVCNYCFRRKAKLEKVPEEGVPDFVAPRLATTPNSEVVYPPGGEKRDSLVKLTYDYSSPQSGFGGAYEAKWYSGTGSGEGRPEPISLSMSSPSLSCQCGRIDDERIDGGFPDDWNNRPKEKLEEIGRRVYHRLDEQEVEIDYDSFSNSLEEYKTSDDYSFGDYKILERSVTDSVSVRPENA